MVLKLLTQTMWESALQLKHSAFVQIFFSLPGESCGRRSLVGYSPGVAKSQTRLSGFAFTFFLWSYSPCLFPKLLRLAAPCVPFSEVISRIWNQLCSPHFISRIWNQLCSLHLLSHVSGISYVSYILSHVSGISYVRYILSHVSGIIYVSYIFCRHV